SGSSATRPCAARSTGSSGRLGRSLRRSAETMCWRSECRVVRPSPTSWTSWSTRASTERSRIERRKRDTCDSGSNDEWRDDVGPKYIFVTGGVVSSLGKGLAAASIGSLLEARGFRVTLQKMDPYINVDAGTMNPYQHGEVFVTDD